MPPPLRNHRTPMLGRTPASTAAFSLDAPRAIASQNLTRCSLRPAGGRPRPRLPAAVARSKARFFLPMATPQRQALRQPVESTLFPPGHVLQAYAPGPAPPARAVGWRRPAGVLGRPAPAGTRAFLRVGMTRRPRAPGAR